MAPQKVSWRPYDNIQSNTLSSADLRRKIHCRGLVDRREGDLVLGDGDSDNGDGSGSLIIEKLLHQITGQCWNRIMLVLTGFVPIDRLGSKEGFEPVNAIFC